MMKKFMACCSGAPFSFCFLLLLLFIATFQTSDAIQCLRKVHRPGDYTNYADVECPATCVAYVCSGVEAAIGCVHHFFDDCANDAKSVEFIRSRKVDKIVYNDFTVVYVSECNDLNCPRAQELRVESNKTLPTKSEPLWYYEKPGDIPANEMIHYDGIQCTRLLSVNKVPKIEFDSVRCPFCTEYACEGVVGFGCASNFYQDCAKYSNAIQFIKSKTPEQLIYFDGKVAYVSECENKTFTKQAAECLDAKVDILRAQLQYKKPSEMNPIWYYKTPGDAPQEEYRQESNRDWQEEQHVNYRDSNSAKPQEDAFKVCAGMMMAFLGFILRNFI